MQRSYYSCIRASILLSLGLSVACTSGGEATVGSTSEGTGGTGSSGEATSAGTESGSTANTGGSSDTSGTATEGSGSTDTSGTATEGSSGSTDTSGGGSCEGSTPIDQEFVEPATPSGFESCPDGSVHRVQAITCEAPATPDSCVDNSGGGACDSAADCVEFPYGSCQQDQVFGGVIEATTCSCVYGCADDNDCDAGQICRCAGQGLGLYTECIAGDCTDDSECGDYLCGLSPDTCAPGGFLTACHGEADLCYSDLDCPDLQPCFYDDSKNPAIWACNDAVCGRPLMIGQIARRASVCEVDPVQQGAWVLGISPEVQHLSGSQRRRLCEHWSAIAAMEHASVASFARALLELVAVGAPAELLAATQGALADEIKHAQRTFALASAYGGRELGPGPLAIDGAFCGAASRLRLAEAVAREGCVAETLAAAEVRAASEAASDPVIRRVLAEIATDEEEHARLAWRTLNWLLEGLSSDAVSGVLEVLHHALDGALAAADGTSNEDASLEIFGVLSAKARGIVVRCAGEEIVRPCARAMSKAA